MNWDDLRIFLSVARQGTLSGAAKSLRIDPATVGRRIERLERELDAILFVKSPQGYVATSAGERLTKHAKAAEQTMTGALQEVRGAAEEGLTGTIRVGAPDGCATFLLPHVTERIVAANPGLDVQIVAKAQRKGQIVAHCAIEDLATTLKAHGIVGEAMLFVRWPMPDVQSKANAPKLVAL